MEIKESNNIVISVKDFEDRNSLITILAINGYEVTVKVVTDIICGSTYFVIANKVV